MAFGLTKEELTAKMAVFTAEEIAQQPETWKITAAQVAAVWEELHVRIDALTQKQEYAIIFTGAGTSEYVGNTLAFALRPAYYGHVQSFGTTDIVAAPRAFLSPDMPTLLVSFARSGNSPESVGAVAAADALCSDLSHLFITCNADGALARTAKTRGDCFSLMLAPETNDRGFAMTSSFTNMYLAALLALSPQPVGALDAICDAASRFLADGWKKLSALVNDFAFSRIAYLGTGALKGAAQESALKMLELTAGLVAAVYDTPMGFRHGPKSIVNAQTLSVVYLSDAPATRRYEMDVLRELRRDRKGSRILTVTNAPDAEAESLSDVCIALDCGMPLENALLAPLYVLIPQSLALLRSVSHGITPDNPCPTGEVNRVVKGVTIYPAEV